MHADDEDDLHALFFAHADALRDQEDLFADLYEIADPAESSVSAMRRRRRRLRNEETDVVKTVSLVDEDGVLYWRNGVPAQPASRSARRGRAARGRRRGDRQPVDDRVVLTRDFPVLAPNKVTQAVAAIDRRLNPAIDETMRSRLRPLERLPDGRFELGEHIQGPFAKGKTLVLVHGTFSNAASMLGEFSVEPGASFLARAFNAYERVVFFDHPTLAVSPILNALELARLVGATTAPIDVIAHSRGGLVVRWWLEAFGAALGTGARHPAPVRAVFAGSPLYGTSLAAPDKIKQALDLLSNIGTFAQVSLKLIGAANPFLWVAGKLIEVIVSIVGALAKTPAIDAATALIPGLVAQSAVSNNLEIDRLRRGPSLIDPRYFAIVSNFETKDPRWRFWRNFRKDRLMDIAADGIFPGKNDLVVDTSSMTALGVRGMKLADKPCDFRTSDEVWHCNYFRQPRAIEYIADKFQV